VHLEMKGCVFPGAVRSISLPPTGWIRSIGWRVLVEFARAHQAHKRGGGLRRIELDEEVMPCIERGADLIALDDALNALAVIDPREANVVELRFFGGLTVDETAEALGVSDKTVMRDWELAKVWLLHELKHKG